MHATFNATVYSSTAVHRDQGSHSQGIYSKTVMPACGKTAIASPKTPTAPIGKKGFHRSVSMQFQWSRLAESVRKAPTAEVNASHSLSPKGMLRFIIQLLFVQMPLLFRSMYSSCLRSLQEPVLQMISQSCHELPCACLLSPVLTLMLHKLQ